MTIGDPTILNLSRKGRKVFVMRTERLRGHPKGILIHLRVVKRIRGSHVVMTPKEARKLAGILVLHAERAERR